MITWDYHVILRIYGFPFEEIKIVLVTSQVVAATTGLVAMALLVRVVLVQLVLYV